MAAAATAIAAIANVATIAAITAKAPCSTRRQIQKNEESDKEIAEKGLKTRKCFACGGQNSRTRVRGNLTTPLCTIIPVSLQVVVAVPGYDY